MFYCTLSLIPLHRLLPVVFALLQELLLLLLLGGRKNTVKAVHKIRRSGAVQYKKTRSALPCLTVTPSSVIVLLLLFFLPWSLSASSNRCVHNCQAGASMASAVAKSRGSGGNLLTTRCCAFHSILPPSLYRYGDGALNSPKGEISATLSRGVIQLKST